MKPFILFTTLLICPVLAQATEIVSPVLILIDYVYESTHVIAALGIVYGLWQLVCHMNDNSKESSIK